MFKKGLRIIGGKLKGRKLQSAPGKLIRPTGNRQREAIFNILADRVHGSNVLDLFAGTGALGIEALSRGATYCVFIDNHSNALRILELNVQSCMFKERSRIIRCDICTSLDPLNSIPCRFDLVFMDPPYQMNYVKPALDNLLRSRCLTAGATVVVEHAPAESISIDESAYLLSDKRRYGKTLVSFLRYVL
ncbi:MAG: 16S rRNA (guanine(966)-N(2))-methyltransferase RsmD [Deltaproteobacteria bacterium]|nr:16S rRNA (guanine(966)-N(2))-methyltransferase RsmD [Deltaproteobacteria bacterium]MBW1960373.1 16S rRNA (guanine(966)-N(2))-methyltransferase RsmD [Deltaproteobacteria bacterium]MBW1993373.1 16S rRNA (guanine(966)-N(2))-methyltransferase RsmD [Deltaproteobacteria bacterium]MBW2151631.1 16S rRNA (guanine(966)-N(2))-methyltransferase RsmD [Deltaproteobacteria bacterium]